MVNWNFSSYRRVQTAKMTKRSINACADFDILSPSKGLYNAATDPRCALQMIPARKGGMARSFSSDRGFNFFTSTEASHN